MAAKPLAEVAIAAGQPLEALLDLAARLAPSAASSDEMRKRSRNGVITRGIDQTRKLVSTACCDWANHLGVRIGRPFLPWRGGSPSRTTGVLELSWGRIPVWVRLGVAAKSPAADPERTTD